MTDTPDLLKIGDFARVAGTNLRTLRYYEELGLIRPAARSTGGFRYYRPTDVHRVHLIRDLQELGLHLDRIRVLLAARAEQGEGPRTEDDGSSPASESRSSYLCRVREALLEHERLLCERMSMLQAQRQRITVALMKLGACETCPHTPKPENNFCEPCQRTGDQLPDLLSALF